MAPGYGRHAPSPQPVAAAMTARPTSCIAIASMVPSPQTDATARLSRGPGGRAPGRRRPARDHFVIIRVRPRAFALPAGESPEFAGLYGALLQLLVEGHLNSAAARRREARNEEFCANLVTWGRYKVASSPQTLRNFAIVWRINITPSAKSCIFHVAPNCSLIHDWSLLPGTGAMCAGDGPPGHRRCDRTRRLSKLRDRGTLRID